MKLMIIGATGYVGSHLTEYFKLKGWELYIKRCDLKEQEEIEKAILHFQPDYIINCAFEGVGSKYEYSKKYVLDNITMFLNLLEACKKGKNLKKIINIGSVSENYLKSIYGIVKHVNYLLGKFVAKKYNLPLVIIKADRLYKQDQIKSFCQTIYEKINLY